MSAHTVHVHPAANNWIQITIENICSICSLMVKQMVWDFNWLRGKLCTPSTAVTWSQLSHDHSCHMITSVTWTSAWFLYVKFFIQEVY